MPFVIFCAQGLWVSFFSVQQDCKIVIFLQVVKSLLDLKDEQLAVQMDAQDSLWGETGAFLLSVRYI